MPTTSEQLQWRFVVPGWWQAAVGLVVLAWAFSAAGNVATAWKVVAMEQATRQLAAQVGRLGNATPNASGAKDQGIDSVLTRTAKRLSLLAAAYVLLAVYFAYLWVRALLQGKRGRVLVGREGMQITDWRGRSREVAWSQVQRASLIDCAGFRKPPRLILKLAGGTVRFSLWLVAPNLLLKEIVRRADLREAPRNWYRQSYIRTGTAD